VSDADADLERLERARLQALVGADLDVARTLHADDYELVTPGGQALTKEGYLGGIATGRLRYRTFEPVGPIRARVRGATAILRYRVCIDIHWEGGRDEGEFWHTDYWEQRAAGWQAVWSQATRIPVSDDP
jgi:hypothetical protein